LIGDREGQLVAQLTRMIEPVVRDLGLELVDLVFRRETHGWVLRLVIDSDPPVTLDDCSRVSREVGYLLEVEDPIDHPYNLEVSSPGLDRPLKRLKDFQRSLGKKAKVVTKEPVQGENVFVGVLSQVSESCLTIQGERGETRIPMEKVARARLVVEWS